MMDVSGLFTESGLIAFGIGVICTRAVYFAKDKWMDVHNPKSSPHVHTWKVLPIAWAMIFVVVAYVGFEAQAAKSETLTLTSKVLACNNEFLKAASDRATWSDSTDHWSNVKTVAISNWLHAMVSPPPNILAIRDVNPNDERVQVWSIDTTAYYLGIIDDAQHEQDVALGQRLAHSLPPSTCGSL